MSQTSVDYIYQEVAAVLRAGCAVDICQLSQRIQAVCEGMQLSEIEVLVGAAVAKLRGAAYWDRQQNGDTP